MPATTEKVLDITMKAVQVSETVTKIVREITPKVADFVIKATANVQETAGKASLSLKLIVHDHPKDGLYVELSGAETLCAGKDRWSAHIEQDQLRIDFPEVVD